MAWRGTVVAAVLLGTVAPRLVGQAPEGPLVVFNAGSLAVPFQRLLEAFSERHPGVRASQEHSGSLAAVRKLLEFDRIPDVIAIADRTLFPRLLQPTHVDWYAIFAGNEMVLAASPLLDSAARATSETWPEVLLEPDTRWGHADPEVDPAGYRTSFVFDLAERQYRQAGLGQRLRDRAEPRFIRPKSADLVALLQLGEIDYAWMYASMARLHRLPAVHLPPEIDLSLPELAGVYGTVSVSVPGRTRRDEDRVVILGSPIEFALSVPIAAPHRNTGLAFARFVISAEGQAILEDSGLRVRELATLIGTPPDKLAP